MVFDMGECVVTHGFDKNPEKNGLSGVVSTAMTRPPWSVTEKIDTLGVVTMSRKHFRSL